MNLLSRLEGFFWVARTGGFAAAARAFPYPITPGGVHHQVRLLEKELEVSLFVRARRSRTTLTAEGRRFLDYVGPFLEGLEVEARSLRSGELAGTLRVRAAAQVVTHLLPRWLQRLRREHPRLEVELSEGGTRSVGDVLEGKVDVLVDFLPHVPPGIQTETVAVQRGWWVVSARHPAVQGRRFQPRRLQDDCFVSFLPEQFQRAFQFRALALSGLTPRRTLSAQSAESIVNFVAAQLGYSVVPWLPRGGPKKRGVVVRPFEHPEAHFPVSAAWRAERAVPRMVQAFLDAAPGDERVDEG